MAVHTCAVCLAAGCGRTAEGEDFFFLLFPFFHFPICSMFHFGGGLVSCGPGRSLSIADDVLFCMYSTKCFDVYLV